MRANTGSSAPPTGSLLEIGCLCYWAVHVGQIIDIGLDDHSYGWEGFTGSSGGGTRGG